MSSPLFTDNIPTPIRRYQGVYTRLTDLGCVNMQDEGNYICRAGVTGSPNVVNTTMNIDILGIIIMYTIISTTSLLLLSTDIPYPNMSITQTSGQPTAGQTYFLNCSVQSFQTPITTHYIWTDMSSGQVSGSSVLSFDPLRTSYGGQYTCTVTVGECETQSVTGEKSRQLIVASKYIIISW